MVETFLNTEFEGGRHQNRVDKISCWSNIQYKFQEQALFIISKSDF
jgi:hypothetical protein